MYKQVTLINSQVHNKASIKQEHTFDYAKKLMSAPITAREFYECCKTYPIVFSKDHQGAWTASVLLGYKEDENLFVDQNGGWENRSYIPASIRRYPFIFIAHDDQEFFLGVDESSLLWDDQSNRLFDDDNNPTQLTQNILAFMNDFQRDALETTNFIEKLESLGFLEAQTARVMTPDQTVHHIDGFFVVNEDRLRSYVQDAPITSENLSMIQLITAHLISLSNLHYLWSR